MKKDVWIDMLFAGSEVERCTISHQLANKMYEKRKVDSAGCVDCVAQFDINAFKRAAKRKGVKLWSVYFLQMMKDLNRL